MPMQMRRTSRTWLCAATFLFAILSAPSAHALPLQFQSSGVSGIGGSPGFSRSDSAGDSYSLNASVPAGALSATLAPSNFVLNVISGLLIGIPLSDLTDSMHAFVTYEAMVTLTGEPGTKARVRATHSPSVTGFNSVAAVPSGDAQLTVTSSFLVDRVDDLGHVLSSVWNNTLAADCIWIGLGGCLNSAESDPFEMIVGDPVLGRLLVGGVLEFYASAHVHDFDICVPIVGCTSLPGIGYAVSAGSAQLNARLLVEQVPEPATLALLAVGLGGLGLSRRKRAAS